MADSVDTIERPRDCPLGDDADVTNYLWDVENKNKPGKMPFGNMWGDWLNGDQFNGIWDWDKTGAAPPPEIFATAFYANAAALVSKMAGAVGKVSEQATYAELARKVKVAYVNTYVDKTTGMIRGKVVDGEAQGGHVQSSYAFALHHDLLIRESSGEAVDANGQPFSATSTSLGELDPDLTSKAVDHLLERLAARDYRMDTGGLGSDALLQALPRYGHADLAYDLLRSRRFPSWLYHFEVGLTEIPEAQDYYVPDRDGRVIEHGGRANVFNLFGCITHWLFSHIAGIRPDPENPGFENVIIHPEVGGGLTCADATYDSMHGPIRSHWWIRDPQEGENRLHIDVSIPPNTTADLYIPAEDLMRIWVVGDGDTDSRAVVSEGIIAFEEAEEEGIFVFELQSGDYQFYSVSDLLFSEACTGDCPCGSDSE